MVVSPLGPWGGPCFTLWVLKKWNWPLLKKVEPKI